MSTTFFFSIFTSDAINLTLENSTTLDMVYQNFGYFFWRTRSDVHLGLVLTAAGHVCHSELQSVKTVSLCSQILEQSIFKVRFLVVIQHRMIRDPGGLSAINYHRRGFLVANVR